MSASSSTAALQPDSIRLVASYLSCVDVSTKSISQPGETVKIADCHLLDPDVTWSLMLELARTGPVVVASIKLQNVSGPHQSQVQFTGKVTQHGGASTVKHETVIGAEGLIFSMTRNYNSGTFPLEVSISVFEKGPLCKNGKGEDLKSHLRKLFEGGALTDVVLEVQGGDKVEGGQRSVAKTFSAHKAVLGARSPVFQRLFETDMAEAQTSSVAVSFSVEVTEHVLRYAYTDKVDFGADGAGDSNVAMDVLAAADYYQLQGLKDACEAALLRRVGNKPAELLQTVVLADRYGALKLKCVALDLAASNPKLIQQRPDWALFLQNHRNLVDELFTVLAEKLVPQ